MSDESDIQKARQGLWEEIDTVLWCNLMLIAHSYRDEGQEEIAKGYDWLIKHDRLPCRHGERRGAGKRSRIHISYRWVHMNGQVHNDGLSSALPFTLLKRIADLLGFDDPGVNWIPWPTTLEQAYHVAATAYAELKREGWDDAAMP